MADKIEGYKNRGTPYTPSKPKTMDVQMKSPMPTQGPSMGDFLSKMGSSPMPTSTIDEHMANINAGRDNVPDNYKDKTK